MEKTHSQCGEPDENLAPLAESGSPEGTEGLLDSCAVEPQTDTVGAVVPGPLKKSFVVLSAREDFNTECLGALHHYGIEPVVVNDPDDMRSITEMVTQFFTISFAVILLAGDDFIYDRLIGKPAESSLGAKQPAVFFLGYFLAKFGHAGTVILFREQKSFRLPVGLQHAAFISWNKDGAWKQILEGKLKARGLI